MDDHEQLHQDLAADADHLESRNEQVEQDIEAARDARDSAASDDFIAHEAPDAQSTANNDEPIGDLTDIGGGASGDDGPPPEASYTSKE